MSNFFRCPRAFDAPHACRENETVDRAIHVAPRRCLRARIRPFVLRLMSAWSWTTSSYIAIGRILGAGHNPRTSRIILVPLQLKMKHLLILLGGDHFRCLCSLRKLASTMSTAVRILG